MRMIQVAALAIAPLLAKDSEGVNRQSRGYRHLTEYGHPGPYRRALVVA